MGRPALDDPKTKRPTYFVWDSMKQRCRNPNNPKYPGYGARGIKVCARWEKSYENFIEDMGPRPEGYSIDRIDNDKGYYKENCRWADRRTQQRNRRGNRLITYKGKTQTLQEWGEELEIKPNTILTRIRRGWPTCRALGFGLE